MVSNSKVKPVLYLERSGGVIRTTTTLPVSDYSCSYSAQVDDNPARQLNAQSAQTHSSLLFRQDNLASGNHILVVTNRGGGFTSLAIGSAMPIIWSNGPPPSTSSTSPSAGVIAGAVVAAVVGLAVLLLALLWFFHRRQQMQRAERHDIVHSTNEPTFIDATPCVLPPAETESVPSVRGSKVTDDEHTQSGMNAYQALPRSPGMNSHGSFDRGPGGMGMGVPGSSSAGVSVGWAAAAAWSGSGSGWARGGKERRHSGSTTRRETNQDSLRDRDAGPVLLPQLPPAYSSATAGASAMSDPAPSSGPSLVSPASETVQVGGMFQARGGSPVPAPISSPRPGPA
ncbi:hypothetical protein FRC08_015791 [Ceratobasidium sp. 394]|nr:hypothetical protein FRC08_015791 [Ceratobasidium sp. 394]